MGPRDARGGDMIKRSVLRFGLLILCLGLVFILLPRYNAPVASNGGALFLSLIHI